jgi:hypothetical protein
MDIITHRLRFRKLSCTIIAISIFVSNGSAQSIPPLINYQGRLTDQAGALLPAGSYGIQFRLWDSPTATGTNDFIWGQQQTVALLTNGVFNAILGALGGSPITNPTPQVNNLAYAFANSNCFLGVTVAVSNGMVLPTTTEILPRQQLLSVPYSFLSQTAASVIPHSIVNASLTPALVLTTNLGDGQVTLSKLAPRQIGTNVGVGGVALSLPLVYDDLTATAFQDVSNLAVTIQTTGRPVLAMIVPSLSNNYSNTPATTPDGGFVFTPNSGANYGFFRLVRDNGASALTVRFGTGSGSAVQTGYSTVVTFLDIPPAGSHDYKLQWGFVPGGGGVHASLYNVVLTIFEF